MYGPAFNDYSYVSPHGSMVLKERSMEKHIPTEHRRKRYSKKQVSTGIVTTGLMVGSAVAAYKFRGNIGQAIRTCSQAIADGAGRFASKWPNLAQACSSFAKACKTPIEALKKVIIK